MTDPQKQTESDIDVMAACQFRFLLVMLLAVSYTFTLPSGCDSVGRNDPHCLNVRKDEVVRGVRT